MTMNDERLITLPTGKLLRLRKDIPTTIPVFEAQQLWERLVRPLFKPHQLVNQELVQLGPGSIVQKLNSELSLQEQAQDRLGKRSGVYLADDDYGLLVTAMIPSKSNYLHITSDILIKIIEQPGDRRIYEVKPKWLTQSPSAPPNSIRCRTCALTAFRDSPQGMPKTYCPLDLISKHPSDTIYATKLLLPPKSPPAMISRFAHFLQKNPLLQNLRDVQAKLDTCGPLDADCSNERFRLAMTLRDCSVYIRFPENEKDDDSKIEARLGDLDVKSAEKGEAWKEQERKLVDGGWYTGTEARRSAGEITCALGRKFRTEDRI